MVDECKRQLIEKKFVELKEKETWDIKPGGRVSFIPINIILITVYHILIFYRAVFCSEQFLNHYCICCGRSIQTWQWFQYCWSTH